MQTNPNDNAAQKTKKTVKIVAFAAVFMFAFAFMMVPLYSVVCKVTGLNGKFDLEAGSGVAVAATRIDTSREVEVIFLATKNEKLAWDFEPTTTRVTLHPGEDVKLAYYAKNNSGKRMTVQAVPSVFPGTAAKYIQKTECFCFTQQTFDADQGQEMPLILRLDQDLPKNVNTVVLSYTMFDASNFVGKVLDKIPGHIN